MVDVMRKVLADLVAGECDLEQAANVLASCLDEEYNRGYDDGWDSGGDLETARQDPAYAE